MLHVLTYSEGLGTSSDCLLASLPLQDIYRLLVTSLRTSSVHFQQLTVESATVGLWGLSKKHATAQGTSLPGKVVAPDNRCAQPHSQCKPGQVLCRAFAHASSHDTLVQPACRPCIVCGLILGTRCNKGPGAICIPVLLLSCVQVECDRVGVLGGSAAADV